MKHLRKIQEATIVFFRPILYVNITQYFVMFLLLLKNKQTMVTYTLDTFIWRNHLLSNNLDIKVHINIVWKLIIQISDRTRNKAE